jgi:acetolactate synthase regulatory subunit
MSNTIQVHFDRLEGSLQRIIGLVERRGFHIDSMQMGEHDAATRTLALHVRGCDDRRCTEVLGRQIDRLYGVRRVTAAADTDPIPEDIVCAA